MPALIAGAIFDPLGAAEPSNVLAWQRWEHALTSDRSYENPYSDVTMRVTYTGPGSRLFHAYGFWDGERTFRIRCAFPTPGTWRWETESSDTANAGLHRQVGTVEVSPYDGPNPLYRHGFLRVSDNRRYLTMADGTPFLWMGDTAWSVPQRAKDAEWDEYLANRLGKHFTVLQVAPASEWAGPADREGNKPFTDDACTAWNPAYWQAFERKIQDANERGLVVLLVGVMEPVRRYPDRAQACLFARNIAARLFGNFIAFSPSFDSEAMALGDDVGQALRDATTRHLITQHPGTPWNEPTPAFSDFYYDKDYLDIAGVQSGHNGGNREWCAHHAIEWVLHLYRHEPHKPVINLEAMYDAHGEKGWQAIDARGLGWRSWLSGACGYTYGAGDLPPKVPNGNGGVWRWVTDPDKDDFWRKAMQWDSAYQMQYLHDFLANLEWWRLEPASGIIRNQPEDVTRRMALARTPKGDLAVAYLPNNEGIEMDLSGFPAPMRARWFDPVQGKYIAASDIIENSGTHLFAAPARSDWVLLLQAPAHAVSPIQFEKRVIHRGYYCDGVTAADIDRDGQQDIVAGPFLYFGPAFTERVEFHAAHEFPTAPSPTDSMFSYVHDFNGDGWPDILALGRVHLHEAFWYENPGKRTGSWNKHFVFHRVLGESPPFVDVDRDGRPELAAHWEGHWGLIKPDPADATGPWQFHPLGGPGTWPQFYHGEGIGDVDGDGRADLLLNEGWYAQPAGTGKPWRRHDFQFAEKGGAQMFACDVDGDGDADVITSLDAHGWGLAWFEQVRTNGDLSFREHRIMGSRAEVEQYGVAFSQLHALAIADLDGDGLQDIVTGKRRWAHGPTGDVEPGAAPVVYWFRLERSPGALPRFVPYFIDDASGVGVQITVQDMNGDGRPDVLTASKLGTFLFLNHAGNQTAGG